MLWEDQQKINLFGRLNSRLKELEMELKVLREETANLDDASDEIYISDEIKYALGEVFIDADQDQVEEMISEQMDKSKALMKKTEKEQEEILERMKVLKGELYAKFGKGIFVTGGARGLHITLLARSPTHSLPCLEHADSHQPRRQQILIR